MMSFATGRLFGLAVFVGLFAACTNDPSQEQAQVQHRSGSGLKAGDEAPAFSLPSVSGDDVSLAEFRGKKAVLLYFSMGPG